jgi:RNA ligase (TIGR02306 family)
MKLATIERIKKLYPHPNADTLSIAEVLGYQAIVKNGVFNENDLIVFIQPDTVLPDAPWASMYKAKSNRVRSIKLRGQWSMGIVESLSILGKVPQDIDPIDENYIGYDVAGILGVTKYEPPIPQDLSAKGNLPYGIMKTDEERYQNIDNLPFGEIVDVNLKVDGSSMTVYCKKVETSVLSDIHGEYEYQVGVTSRSLELKLDKENKYTTIVNKLNLIDKLKAYCNTHNVNIAIRGELYGNGIQGFKHNPHATKPLGFAVFNVLNLDTLKYEGIDSPLYYEKVAQELNIETVPMVEKSVELTPELIKKYDEGIDKINGVPFEGVVIKLKNGNSFKVINKSYDSNK